MDGAYCIRSLYFDDWNDRCYYEKCMMLMKQEIPGIRQDMSSTKQCLLTELMLREMRPIMEKGQSILEVKWDEFIPGYIKQNMDTNALQRSSFSKYYLCRRFNTYGGSRI